MFKIPMLAEVELELSNKISLKTPLGDLSVHVWNTDEDNDGNPEFNVKIDLPGEGFDQTFKVEIPAQSLLDNGIKGVTLAAVHAIPDDFPFKDTVVGALEALTD